MIGLVAIVCAYLLWGLFPVYFRWLADINALELLNVRILLTALTCLIILPLRGSWNKFLQAWQNRRELGIGMAAALLLAANWFAFMWAVQSGKVLESSMGYFLSPLCSVFIAWLVEKESLPMRRWLAVALASGGVVIFILQATTFPLAALVIALTWSGYGWLKKRTPMGPLVGLGIETTLLAPLAIFIILIQATTAGHPLTLQTAAPSVQLLMLAVGIITATPLLLFAFAAQRIRLSTMGFGQYIVPSIHFALAWGFGETLTLQTLLGFGLIWLALALYAASGRPTPVAPPRHAH